MATESALLQLGTVRKMDPSEVWQHENDFTPWLHDNLGAVCERLGLTLEASDCEVGPFDTTLIGRDAKTGLGFIFETQIAPADQLHLGQLLAAASAHDARLVVWVAPEFTPEHRQAIEWLNAVTHEDYRFLGVRIEIVGVGDARAIDVAIDAAPTGSDDTSIPLPEPIAAAEAVETPVIFEAPVVFALPAAAEAVETPEAVEIVEAPPLLVELPPLVSEEQPPDRHATWTRFLEKLASHDATAAAIEASSGEWLAFPDGYSAGLVEGGTTVEYEVPAIEAFDGLLAQAEAIEQAVGFKLAWVRDEEAASRVTAFTPTTWGPGPECDQALDWMVETVSLFRNVFPLFQAVEPAGKAPSGRKQKQPSQQEAA